MIESLPGIAFKPAPDVSGLTHAGFNLLHVDTTMGQDSPLGWYCMLRPLGDPLDKNAAEGWRSIFSEMQALMEKLAVKYLSHEGYIIFSLDNVRAFRNVIREILKTEAAVKSGETGKKYWPCVMACVMKKGQHFNKDLPRRVNLDWRQLSPDYPHMSFKSALYLGKGFRINDVRHSSGNLGGHRRLVPHLAGSGRRVRRERRRDTVQATREPAGGYVCPLFLLRPGRAPPCGLSLQGLAGHGRECLEPDRRSGPGQA